MKFFTYIMGIFGYVAMGGFLKLIGYTIWNKEFWIAMMIVVWVDWMASWHARLTLKYKGEKNGRAELFE